MLLALILSGCSSRLKPGTYYPMVLNHSTEFPSAVYYGGRGVSRVDVVPLIEALGGTVMVMDGRWLAIRVHEKNFAVGEPPAEGTEWQGEWRAGTVTFENGRVYLDVNAVYLLLLRSGFSTTLEMNDGKFYLGAK